MIEPIIDLKKTHHLDVRSSLNRLGAAQSLKCPGSADYIIATSGNRLHKKISAVLGVIGFQCPFPAMI